MIVNNGDTHDISRLDLAQASAARQPGDAGSSSSGSVSATPANDSITLTTTSGVVQQALASGAEVRSARIQQLKQLIDANQYHVDAVAISRALIDAHLAGD